MKIDSLQKLYEIEIKKIEEVKRCCDKKPAYKIISDKGIFFLKPYEELNGNVIEGLKLLEYLNSKGYPAVKVIRSKNGNYIEMIDNTPIALFEWIEYEKYRVKKSSLKQARILGEYLARLHKLTENYDFPENELWSVSLTNLLTHLYKNKKFIERNASDVIKSIYYEILDILENLEIPENLPKAVTHGEFTFKHVLFDKSVVYKIIDWDFANRDYMFLDMALPMFDMYSNYSEEYVIAFFEGYSKIRPLTKWERENLDKVCLIGGSIYFWWTLDDVKRKRVRLEEALSIKKVIDSIKRS